MESCTYCTLIQGRRYKTCYGGNTTPETTQQGKPQIYMTAALPVKLFLEGLRHFKMLEKLKILNK